jgi:hypothetical protein
MPISTRTLEQIELDLETARGQVATMYLDPTVSDDTKMLAAAIVQAGAQIALATAHENGRRGDGSS